jgi:hypothetical protein
MAETTSVTTQPATFIEAESKLYLDQLKDAIGGLKGADLSKIMGPQFVAGMDPLTQQAIGMAGGLGSYAPYLQAAGAATGPRCLSKLICLHINKMLLERHYQEYDIQAQKGLPQGVPATSNCCRCIWWWYEKVYKEQSINLHQIEIELHYKHNYYNKVLVKHKI